MTAWRPPGALILSVLITACGSGPSAPTPTDPAAVTTGPISLTSCASLRSGVYVVASDICSGINALTILEGNVSIDCRNHKILSNVFVSTGLTNVSIANCIVAGEISGLVNTSRFTISHSVLSKGMSFTNASSLLVDGNQLSSTLRSASPAQVWVLGGTDVTITNNIIDGNYSGNDRSGQGHDAQTNGVDDGIVLADVTSATITGNTISNVFDAGIEGISTVQNATITNNTIAAIVAGVSSYYCTAWSNNTIANNTISGTNNGFLFEFVSDNRCAKDGNPPQATGVFTNNVFDGNVVINVFSLGLNIRLDSTASVSGNLVRNNNFTGQGISVVPLAGFINGGGNTCNDFGNFRC